MNRLIAYLFVVGVGSGVLNYHSTSGPLFSLSLLAILGITLIGLLGEAAVKSGEIEAIGKFFSPKIVLWVAFLSLPLIVMAVAREEFQRGMWTTYTFNVVVFALGALLALERKLRGATAFAAVTVVAVGALMNLFEFFVHNNMWSIAPGRSAGFLMNPNISAANLVAYSVIYFGFRAKSLRRLDFVVLAVTCAGIFVTFSRTGYVLFALSAIMCFMSRRDFQVNGKSLFWFGCGLIAGAGLLWLGIAQIMPELHMTEDAGRRLESFIGGTAGEDFVNERLGIGIDGWKMFKESPFTGIGFAKTVRLDPGPHNMYVGVALAYGIGGLVTYFVLIITMLWSAYKTMGKPDEAWLVVMLSLWLLAISLASHNILYDCTNLLALSIPVALAGAWRAEQDADSEIVDQESQETSV